jgi:hypothetical protein
MSRFVGESPEKSKAVKPQLKREGSLHHEDHEGFDNSDSELRALRVLRGELFIESLLWRGK